MGLLVDGQWKDRWYDTESTGGRFERQMAQFRSWVTADGAPGPTGEGGFKAESGRYHLFVSLACPWAHRTLIFRKLKGLEPHIGVSIVHPDMLDEGWTFDAQGRSEVGDPLFGLERMHQLYTRADRDITSRVTVPVLWDTQQGRIVSNESSEIIRMFNGAFQGIVDSPLDFNPAALRSEIDAVNERVYDTLNNGVYKCGFATTQQAYDENVGPLFDTLEWLESRLETRPFVAGDKLTEADWRLFTTLARFDLVYHGHFKCNRKRIVDLPRLWAYTRALYQIPGVAETTDFWHISRHYHYSHETINPHRVIPTGPQVDWMAPSGRPVDLQRDVARHS